MAKGYNPLFFHNNHHNSSMNEWDNTHRYK